MAKKKASESKNSTASIGVAAKLWLAVDLVNCMVALPYQLFWWKCERFLWN